MPFYNGQYYSDADYQQIVEPGYDTSDPYRQDFVPDASLPSSFGDAGGGLPLDYYDFYFGDPANGVPNQLADWSSGTNNGSPLYPDSWYGSLPDLPDLNAPLGDPDLSTPDPQFPDAPASGSSFDLSGLPTYSEDPTIQRPGSDSTSQWPTSEPGDTGPAPIDLGLDRPTLPITTSGPVVPPTREELPVPTNTPTTGGSNMSVWDSIEKAITSGIPAIINKIGGGNKTGTGTGTGTGVANPQGGIDPSMAAILAVLGPVLGGLANTEAARTGKSSSSTSTSNTSTSTRNLTPAQQGLFDQLTSLSQQYMTDPMKAVAPLRAPGMAQINKNYAGAPQAIANKTLAFGGNSGKFGKAVQASELGRYNDLSGLEGTLAGIGYQGQQFGANLGSSIAAQPLSSTVSNTGTNNFEGTNVNPGSVAGGATSGAVSALTSILLLDQLMKKNTANQTATPSGSSDTSSLPQLKLPSGASIPGADTGNYFSDNGGFDFSSLFPSGGGVNAFNDGSLYSYA